MTPTPPDNLSPLGRTLVWEPALAGAGTGEAPADWRDRAAAARRSRTDLEYLTPAELVERARGLLPLLAEIAAGAGALDVSGSAAGAAGLWGLSRLAVRSADLPLYFDGGVPGILERLDGSPSSDAKEFLDAFDTFLYEHGALGPGPWDIAAEVWETSPELALTEIDRLRALPDGEAPGAVVTPSPAEGAARLVNEIRVCLREVGRQMADAHHIGAAALVMQLTADELDDFVAHPETWGLKLAARGSEPR
ncbi:MAG TPA: hypothetical protein VHL53_11360 [Acidimicrobiia bacterium]|nr:hypothetical protein [Acidimicrobiia bacterium]